MITRLHLRDFTLFRHFEWKPSESVNVVVGDNGTGKSHLLKLCYAVQQTRYRASRARPDWTREQWQRELASKLVGVFRPDSLGRLVARRAGSTRATVQAVFDRRTSIRFSFANNSLVKVDLDGPVPTPLEQPPIFLPSHEMLSNVPGFASAYDKRELHFDETYPDLARLLEDAPLRGRPRKEISPIRNALVDLLGGTVERRQDQTFVMVPTKRGEGPLEMPLLAEGQRKLATLSYLVRNGQLPEAPSLYWDEPEANLNPKALKAIALLIADLAHAGVQIFVATHSLYLMREFALLQDRGKLASVGYLAIRLNDAGDAEADAGDTINEVEPVASLEADLEQADRFLDVEVT